MIPLTQIVNLDEHNYADCPLIVCPTMIEAGETITIYNADGKVFKGSLSNQNLISKLLDITTSQTPVVIEIFRNSEGKLDCCEI